MASLYITEYGDALRGGMVQIAKEPAINTQKLTVGSETKSTAFKEGTRLIRVHTDAICSIAISSADGSGNFTAATTSYPRLAADQTEYFGVNPGDKLSVISNT